MVSATGPHMASSAAAQAHTYQESEESLVRLLTSDKSQQPKGASTLAARQGVAKQPGVCSSNPQS